MFISYARRDRNWAEWIAWQLEHAEKDPYIVELDVWDWAAGRNLIAAMNNALSRADHVVAVLSKAYFESDDYGIDRWADGLVRDVGRSGRLIPVRIGPLLVPPLLRARIQVNLWGVDEATARQRLLDAVSGPRRPVTAPVFPVPSASGGAGEAGTPAGPRLPGPGALPKIWNIPPANPDFVGRDGVLHELRERLLSGGTQTIQALHGLGGVGKSHIAVEYAHRHSGAYDIMWWVSAEQPTFVWKQLDDLAIKLGGSAEPAPGEGILAFMNRLCAGRRWLLILDDLPGPLDPASYRADGRGHAILTSRNPGFQDAAGRIEIGVFDRSESIRLLRERDTSLTEEEADLLGDTLGDLPLALAQAGSWLAETGTGVEIYLELLGTHTRRILDEGRALHYPKSFAASWRLAIERLERENATAVEVLRLAAFLGPDPLPLALISRAVASADGQAAGKDADVDPIAFGHTVAHLRRYGLARISGRTIQLHRLVQAVLRDQVDPVERPVLRERAWALLAATDPGNPDDPASWPYYAEVLPHLLSADHIAADNPSSRALVMNAVWYLAAHGNYKSAQRIAHQAFLRWRVLHDPDDYHQAWIRNQLARVERSIGNFPAARELDEQAWAICRRGLGDDHPDTLVSANNLAIDLSGLGLHPEALKLDRETWARRRTILGESHPETLSSANNLVVDLTEVGRHQEAFELSVETLERCEQVLGHDHPLTLAAAGNQAYILNAAGQYEDARLLEEDTLLRQRRVLGEDHPETLRTASNLAQVFSDLGCHEESRRLNEDILTRRSRVLGKDHPHTLVSANHLAQALNDLGEYQEAERVLLETRVLSDQEQGPPPRPRPRLLPVAAADEPRVPAGDGMASLGAVAGDHDSGAADGARVPGAAGGE